jgi:hypothetical protein
MTSSHTPDSPKKPPRGSRQSQKHRPKANTKGLAQRAFKKAFVKQNPQVMLKNPVMFVVQTGTIVTALLTIDPTLFGPVFGKNHVVFNGLVTLILFFTLVFANFAEAVTQGRPDSGVFDSGIDDGAAGKLCKNSRGRGGADPDDDRPFAERDRHCGDGSRRSV